MAEEYEPQQEYSKLCIHCTECLYPIEILSLQNNNIKFRCSNMKNTHGNEMSLKDYIHKIKLKPDCEINKICLNHRQEYKYFCFECKIHLCEICLESRDHYNHIKYNLDKEISPKANELKKLKEIIEEEENQIEILKEENDIKNMEDIKEFNVMVYNTFQEYQNNYYNSININKVLIHYYNSKKILSELENNEYINLKKIKKYVKPNIDEYANNIIDGFIKENENIKLDYNNKINEMKTNYETIILNYKNEINEMKKQNTLIYLNMKIELKKFKSKIMIL